MRDIRPHIATSINRVKKRRPMHVRFDDYDRAHCQHPNHALASYNEQHTRLLIIWCQACQMIVSRPRPLETPTA